MKTYLEICKGVCREASIASGESAITSVAANTGQLQRIVANVQHMHQHSGLYWRWMRREFTLTTVSGTSKYAFDSSAIKDTTESLPGTAVSRFRNWLIKSYSDPVKIYLTSSGVGGEGWLTYMDWNEFKYIYKTGTQNSAMPSVITIDPQNKIQIGPVPNDIYTITGDFMLSAQVLLNDGDMPDIPVDFEDLIMWKALSRHGLQKNASELVVIGEDSAATYLGQLESDQLSEIPIGVPLA